MRRIAFRLTVLGVIVAACDAADDIAGLRPEPRVANTEDCRMNGDGNLTAQQKCAIVKAGIDYLVDHANWSCKDVGQRALARFNATTGEGFSERQNPPGQQMSVDMYYGGGTQSGWTANSGYTHVDVGYWTSGQTSNNIAGSLIAHEEKHHDGSDGAFHNTGIAPAWQQACLNPQP